MDWAVVTVSTSMTPRIRAGLLNKAFYPPLSLKGSVTFSDSVRRVRCWQCFSWFFPKRLMGAETVLSLQSPILGLRHVHSAHEMITINNLETKLANPSVKNLHSSLFGNDFSPGRMQSETHYYVHIHRPFQLSGFSAWRPSQQEKTHQSIESSTKRWQRSPGLISKPSIPITVRGQWV